jgi:hypothetical protein
MIVDMTPPTSIKALHMTLGHVGYYCKFIKKLCVHYNIVGEVAKKRCEACLESSMPRSI